MFGWLREEHVDQQIHESILLADQTLAIAELDRPMLQENGLEDLVRAGG